VDRINELEAFSREGHGEIFFADSINPVACKLLSPLIDKEAVLI